MLPKPAVIFCLLDRGRRFEPPGHHFFLDTFFWLFPLQTCVHSSEGRTCLLRLYVSLMYIIDAHSLYPSALLGGSRGIELKGRGSDI